MSNALLALPRGTGNLLAGAAAILEGGVAKATGGDFAIGERYRQQQEVGPAALLRRVPAPTVQDISAGIRSAPALIPGGEAPNEAFARHRADIGAEEASLREAHPVATTVGDVAGDIGALLVARKPIGTQMRRFEAAIAPKIFGEAATPQAMSTGRLIWESTLARPSMRRLLRGLGRSGETGLEAAVMQVMQGDDPLEAAAWGAGAQLGGSAALESLKSLGGHGPWGALGKLTAAAFVTGGALQLLDSSIPGGRDWLIPNLEAGYDKVKWGVILGSLSGALGAGRFRNGDELVERFPQIADAMAATPRAFTMSVLNQYMGAETEGDKESIKNALENVMDDPTYDGENEVERSVIRDLRRNINPFADELNRRGEAP